MIPDLTDTPNRGVFSDRPLLGSPSLMGFGGEAAHKTAHLSANQTGKMATHHDALEFPDGQTVLLTFLSEGQQATVLQLPAEPRTAVESVAQQRAAFVGRSERTTMRPLLRPLWSYGVDAANTPDRKPR
jgi:hypothetical protein